MVKDAMESTYSYTPATACMHACITLGREFNRHPPHVCRRM